MNDLSIEEVTRRVVEGILDLRYFDRQSLSDKVRPILRVWLKQADKTKKYRGVGKRNVPQAKLQYTIDKEKFTCKMWLNELRKVVSEDEMKKLYEAHKTELKRAGLYTYDDWIEERERGAFSN